MSALSVLLVEISLDLFYRGIAGSVIFSAGFRDTILQRDAIYNNIFADITGFEVERDAG